jgi:hypothetical protein
MVASGLLNRLLWPRRRVQPAQSALRWLDRRCMRIKLSLISFCFSFAPFRLHRSTQCFAALLVVRV